MRLISIDVSGFRSVADLQGLSISRPTLLTGHNDAGKSALLDATRFLLGDYAPTERDLTFSSAEDSLPARVPAIVVTGMFLVSESEQAQLDLPAVARVRKRFEVAAGSALEVEMQLPLDTRLRGLSSKLLSELKELAVELELETDARLKDEFVVALQEHAAGTDQILEWVAASAAVVKALPSVERFDPAGVRDADDSIKKALDTAFRAHISGEEHKGNVKDLENAIEAQLVDDASEIRKHIMDRCADIGDVQIVPVVSFSEGLRATQVNVIAREGDGGVGLGESGAGRARRISLAVWEFTTGLLAEAGDVVMIYDEPDTHLDYVHQREFMEIVRSQCSLENVAMLIATHSMNLIDGMDIADVVHVSLDANHRTAIDVLTDETEVGSHLGAIAATVGLRNTVLLHERLFVGVEGPTETGCFPVLFRLATGRHLESCGIAVWGCRNNEGALDFAAFLVQHSRAVVFVVDQDSRLNSKHVFSDTKLSMRGLDPNLHAIYIGEPMELEELFGDHLWVRVGNQRWPRTDGRFWTEADFSQHRSSKFSREVLEMAKVASESGPTSKQDAMIDLALSLQTPDEVPEPLRLVFAELIERAK